MAFYQKSKIRSVSFSSWVWVANGCWSHGPRLSGASARSPRVLLPLPFELVEVTELLQLAAGFTLSLESSYCSEIRICVDHSDERNSARLKKTDEGAHNDDADGSDANADGGGRQPEGQRQ